MTNKLLSKISTEQLIEDFQELKSAHKIAVKYGINVATVYSAFKIIKFDCYTKKTASRLLTKEILEEAHNRLGSMKEMGKELNIDGNTIAVYMDKFNLPYEKQIRYNK